MNNMQTINHQILIFQRKSRKTDLTIEIGVLVYVGLHM